MSKGGPKEIVFDIFAVDLHRKTGSHSLLEQEALLRVGEGIAGVSARVAAHPVRRLYVVRIWRHRLDDPLVAVSRLPARRVEVVEEREALHETVSVRRDLRAEYRQRGVAVASLHVAEDLI